MRGRVARRSEETVNPELATGEISTMDQIVQELDKAEKVITL